MDGRRPAHGRRRHRPWHDRHSRLIGWALGINPALLIGGAQMMNNMRQEREVALPRQEAPRDSAPTDQIGAFVAKVVGSNEQVWSQVLPQQKGMRFQPPRLVLFNGVTHRAAARRSRRWGPSTVRSTRKHLSRHLLLPRHEATLRRRRRFRLRLCDLSRDGPSHPKSDGHSAEDAARAANGGSRSEANALSVRTELMADCLAGVWANNGNARSAISRGRRHRKGGRFGAGDWRRSNAKSHARLRGAGQLHAWLGRATHPVAAERPAHGAASTPATRSRTEV